MKSSLIRTTAVILLLVWGLVMLPVPPAAGQKDSLHQTVTIAFTHDLHDHFLPLKTEQNGRIVRIGGWARLATAIARERNRDPDLLLVDAGDYAMGTMFQMLFADESPGLIMMGMMGFDAVTLGNHEYDFLPEGLARHLQNARIKGDPLPAVIASNVVFPDGDLPEDLALLQQAFKEYPVEDYIVVEKGSLRVGIFGLMGEEADSNAPMAGVEFAEQADTARRIVEILRNQEKVDLVVCLSHSGNHPDPERSEDSLLAQQVQGIDVIISGHSHTLLPEPLQIGSTVIVSAGQYGTRLGVLSLEYADTGWEPAGYRLELLDDSIPKDPVMADQIELYKDLLEDRYLKPLGVRVDTVLAESDFSFTPYDQVGAEHREEPLGNLIADAYRYAVAAAEGENYEEVAVAVVPSGNIRGSFVQGPITGYDAFVVSSLGLGPDGRSGFPLLSVYLTGEELKRVCEVDASITPLMSSVQLYMSGMTYTFNPHRLPLNKVTDAALVDSQGNREEIQDHRLYRVVAGLYSAQMLSVVGEKSFGLLPITPKTMDGEPIENFLDHIIYVERDGSAVELKEWMALTEYLQSFPQENGIPQVPALYREAQGRKNIASDSSLAGVLAQPNALAVKAYLLVTALVFVIALLIGAAVGRYRRRKLIKE